MAEIKSLFSAGRMNKDLDERAVPNGEYRDALNIQVNTSTTGDTGAVQNMLGNKIISLIDGGNPKAIGFVKDDENNKLYWFIASDSKNIIAEFDEENNLVSPIVVDLYDVLKFSKDRNILGINIIDGILFWTDNYSEPRKIKIEKFRAGCDGYDTHTQVHGRNFSEEDTTLIKRSPLSAPEMLLYDTIGGEAVESAAIFNFSKNNGEDPVEVGDTFNVAILNTARDWKVGDILIFTSEGSVAEYGDEEEIEIKAIITSYSNGSNVSIEITSATDSFVNTSINYNILKEQPKALFELKFPRFAYRWKYEDGEYSTFSPFSEIAFIPGNIKFNAKEGYNEGMVNNVRKIELYSFDQAPEDVTEIDILYKESSNNNVYTVETLKTNQLESYNVTSNIIYKVVENNQLLRQWDNVPIKAKTQELISNRLVFGNYTQNYDITTEPSVSTRVLEGNGYNRSIKSDRKYQVGVVFEDKYGRQSPVIANQSGVFNLSRKAAAKNNVLAVKGEGVAPDWAANYRYYIKETSAEYYNVILDKYYLNKDEPNSAWLSIPSSERNKITEDTYLIIKKQHGAEIPVDDETAKYKILDIDNEAPNFLTDKFSSKGQLKATAIATSLQTNASNIEVTIEPNDTLTETIAPGQKIRFVSEGNKSDIYTVSNVVLTNNTLELITNEVFSDNDVTTFGSLTTMNIVFGEIETKNLPEFKNRFFIKLRIDPLLKKYLLLDQPEENANYRIINQEEIKGNTYTNINPNCDEFGPDDSNTGYYWESRSSGNNVIKVRRTGPFNGSGWSYDVDSRFDDFSAKLDIVGTRLKFSDDSSSEVYEIVSSSRSKGDNGIDGFLGIGGLRKISCNRWVQWEIELDKNINFTPNNTSQTESIYILDDIIDEDTNQLTLDSPAIFETEPVDVAELDIYYETEDSFPIEEFNEEKQLRWYNCFSFGNGIESNRIRDDFNGVLMDKQVRVSSVLAEQFKQETKKSGLIYSGIYNTINGINRSNQFNAAEKITKEINPEYGSIQKLYAREGNLLAFCEDKLMRILADKDLLYNADGSANLISSNNVLGAVDPYAGEFGISKNPESFAAWGDKVYFVDKARGVVLRLGASGSGLEIISDNGLKDYLRDKLATATTIIGSYDEFQTTYNLTIDDETIAFSEFSKGWESRYSFVPELATSLNNKYYTFKQGNLWLQNQEDVARNNFYGIQYQSTIKFLLNDSPSAVKKFKTLGYEGDEGWSANYINTNLQKGSVSTFVEKEGKWFNLISGKETYLDLPGYEDNWDSKRFSSQGIGKLTGLTGDTNITVSVLDFHIVRAIAEWRGDTFECLQATTTTTTTAPPTTTTTTAATTTTTTAGTTTTTTSSGTTTTTTAQQWYAIDTTGVVADVYSACGLSLRTTYYATEPEGENVQLYNSQSLSDPLQESGYLRTGDPTGTHAQYNVVDGVLGSAGTCPTGYSLQSFYYGAETQFHYEQCDTDYVLTGVGYAFLPTAGWTVSDLLDKVVYKNNNYEILASLGPDSSYYRSVSPTQGRSTQDGSTIAYIQINNTTGRVETTGEQTCFVKEGGGGDSSDRDPRQIGGQDQ
jgi:hypothetical protein